MKAQSTRKLELKEKERDEKRKQKEEAQPQQERQQRDTTKRWKGKDWFAILAPKMFGETVLFETPATDPKVIVGRNVEVPLSMITGERGKESTKLIFQVNDVKDKRAYTRFNGYIFSREFIYRNVRAGSQKLDIFNYAETKDNWKLQFSVTAILNKTPPAPVEKKTRLFIINFIKDHVKELTIEELVKGVVSSTYQKAMRKEGSKIYPLRFAEISKIEVIKTGEVAA